MDFSKLKELTIAEGKVKRLSINGVKVWEKQMFTLSGKWLFNEVITLPDFITLPEKGHYIQLQAANFTVGDELVNDTLFDATHFTITNNTGSTELFPVYALSYMNDNKHVHHNGYFYRYSELYKTQGWFRTAMLTTPEVIDFGETPQEVSEDFYNWFTSNAVQIETRGYTLKYIHPYSYSEYIVVHCGKISHYTSDGTLISTQNIDGEEAVISGSGGDVGYYSICENVLYVRAEWDNDYSLVSGQLYSDTNELVTTLNESYNNKDLYLGSDVVIEYTD